MQQFLAGNHDRCLLLSPVKLEPLGGVLASLGWETMGFYHVK